jgi:hypothetical protein
VRGAAEGNIGNMIGLSRRLGDLQQGTASGNSTRAHILTFQKKLMLSTALSVPAIFGYGGGRSYAACVNSGGSTYLCSGIETVTQTVTANDAAVTMAPGASVDTSAGAGSAIVISGDGSLSFTNLDGGSIAGASRGLDIQATNGGPAASIYVQSTQNISGGTNGLYSLNSGIGLTNINVAGAAGAAGSGLVSRITNGANSGDLRITATGTVSGGNTGLFAAHYGTGAVAINTAAVDATAGGNGVFARSYGAGLSVSASGTAAGATNGVYTVHHGSSDTNINVVDVSGGTQSAINARHQAAVVGGDLNITSTGMLTGNLNGIYALHSGTGAISINAAAATGTLATGIVARSTNVANTGDISVTMTGTVTGNGGLFAAHYGTGAVAINTAAVDASAGGTGIFARSYGTGLSVTAAGTVAGVTNGVYTVHHGSSATTINVTDVSSSAGSAINARQQAAVVGGDLNITSTGTLTGNQNGIYALHSGTGAIRIDAATVTGTLATGIVARSTNAANMSDISVTTTGAVSGETGGISVSNYGGGAVTINTAAVSTANGRGVFGRTYGTDLSITTSDAVMAEDVGVYATNQGTGSSTINVVDVTSAMSTGVLGVATGGDLTINATGTVSGYSGIDALSAGAGAVTINAVNVIGTTGNGLFANVVGTTSDANITVSGETTSAALNGIHVRHVAQGGALNVNAGKVTGAVSGIRVNSLFNLGTDVNITSTGAVQGGSYGITASSLGTGSLVINATSVAGTSRNGIRAISQNAASQDLRVTATGAVSGGWDGIHARHSGTGMLALDVADVTSTTGFGVYGSSYGAGFAITASGSVTGATDGVRASHLGTGALTIDVASATGMTGNGLVVQNYNAASMGDVVVSSSGHVSGADFGILATSLSSGSMTINAASVEGKSQYGIAAQTVFATSTGLTVSASGLVIAESFGINARHGGTGAISVNATDVTSAQESGVYAYGASYVTSGANVITTGTVTGYVNGIEARLFGAGDLTVNAVNVSADLYAGVRTLQSYSTAGRTRVTTSGDVSGGQWGIFSRNDGTGGAEIAVSGAVTSNDTGIRVYAHGSNQISIVNGGSVAGGSHAIFTSGTTDRNSDDIVMNAGRVSGLVDLGGGVNAFNNSAGGVFDTLGTVMIGAGNALTNAGTVSPGGTGTIQTTALTGNFAQTADGIFAVDVDAGAVNADRLDVTGTATLAGSVALNVSNLGNSQGAVTILSATGGATDNGLTATGGPLAFNATLSYPNANDVLLTYGVDFTPASLAAGLTPNQAAVGEGLNSLFAAGGGGLVATALLGITDPAAYQAVLDQLQGAAFLDPIGRLFGSNHFFVQNLLSCPSRLDGAEAQVVGDECIWGRVEGHAVETDASTTRAGGRETVWGFSGGFEAPIDENARAGISFALETSDAETNNGTFTDGTRVTVGAKVEKTFGALEASLGVFGGFAFYDTTRLIGLAGVGPALSDQEVGSLSSVTRLSYSHELGGLRIVPMIDLAATYVSFGGFSETGAGAANLVVADSDEWIYSATPAIGALGTLITTDDYRVNVSMKAGVSLFSKSGFAASARFAGAQTSFTTVSDFDDVVGNLSAALEWQATDYASVKVGYDGRLGEMSQSHGGFIRAVLPF